MTSKAFHRELGLRRERAGYLDDALFVLDQEGRSPLSTAGREGRLAFLMEGLRRAGLRLEIDE